jgi:large subunit ribosomal protein L5
MERDEPEVQKPSRARVATMEKTMSFLKEKYTTKIVPELLEELGRTNLYEAPRVEKVILNMGLGDAVENEEKVISRAREELRLIAGQEPVITRARRSIASFNLRAGMPIGAKVTLRGVRMYEFLERLIYVALPRVRDFKGINPNAFDGHGNYTLGIREQIIFPEINYDDVDKIRGMNATFVTTAADDVVGRLLLTKIGLPFRRPEGQEQEVAAAIA